MKSQNILLLSLVIASLLASNVNLIVTHPSEITPQEQPLITPSDEMAKVVYDSDLGMSIRCDFYDSDSLNYTQYLRPEYRYLTSTTIQYILTTTTGNDIVYLCVYAPLALDFQSITPYTTNSYSSYNRNFTVIEYQSYEITYLAGQTFGQDYDRQNQFCSITETTSDYFTDIGFENGKYNDDWENSVANAFTTPSINTTIVSSGAFSLRLADTDNSADYFSCQDKAGTVITNNIPSGEYYISFNYYIESISYNGFYLQIYDQAGTTTNNAIPDYTTNRWHTAFFFVKVIDGTYRIMRFLLSSSATTGAVIFIDNFRIYKTNAECITTEYQKASISGSVISWDGLDDPYVDTNTTIELRYRSNNTLVLTKNLMTQNGAFAYTFSTVTYPLYQCEYVLPVICWESWWNTVSTDPDYFETLTFWSGVSTTSYTEAQDTTVKYSNSDGSVKIQATGGNPHYLKLDWTTVINMNYNDIFMCRVKTNETTANSGYRMYVSTSGSQYRGYDEEAWTTSWSLMSQNFLNYDAQHSVATYGEYDAVNVDFMYFFMVSSTSYTVYFDDIHLIQSQKSYFTPQIVTNNDFQLFETTSCDAIDFTEGDYDSLDVTNSHANIEDNAVTITNGYAKIAFTGENTTKTWTFAMFTLGAALDLDTSPYHSFYVRAWASETMLMGIGTGNVPGYRTNSETITTVAQTYLLEYNYLGALNKANYYVYFQEADLSVFEYDEIMYIELIRLVERDNSTLTASETYYTLTSTNNTYQHYVEQDALIYDNNLQDLDLIWKNQTVGSHTLEYVTWNDLDETVCYLSLASTADSYSVEEVSQSQSKVEYNVTATQLSSNPILAGQPLLVNVTVQNTTDYLSGVNVMGRVRTANQVLSESAIVLSSNGVAYLSLNTNWNIANGTVIYVDIIAVDENGAGYDLLTTSWIYRPVSHPPEAMPPINLDMLYQLYPIFALAGLVGIVYLFKLYRPVMRLIKR